jgi:hypothetical protein
MYNYGLLNVLVYPPEGYDRNLPLKLVSGGFLISTRGK